MLCVVLAYVRRFVCVLAVRPCARYRTSLTRILQRPIGPNLELPLALCRAPTTTNNEGEKGVLA